MTSPMLNPDLDVDTLKNRFQEDNRILIEDFLTSEAAGAVQAAMNTQLQYELLFFLDGANRAASPAQMQALTNEQRQQLQQQIVDLASKGIGFLYCSYRMEKDSIAAAPPVLRELFDTMTGPDVIALIREISGKEDLQSASGQYTRYEPGHFLTRHSDDVTTEGRSLAYVMNVSSDWHTDWGGLLQFFTSDGKPRDAWVPGFNRLALFDVNHVHAVSYVTPFARAPRLALTGWFSRNAG